MSDQERIKAAFERVVGALSRRPSLGHGTGVSKARVDRGLRPVGCDARRSRLGRVADLDTRRAPSRLTRWEPVRLSDEGLTAGHARLRSVTGLGYVPVHG
jgi:hypothetical protein